MASFFIHKLCLLPPRDWPRLRAGSGLVESGVQWAVFVPRGFAGAVARAKES